MKLCNEGALIYVNFKSQGQLYKMGIIFRGNCIKLKNGTDFQ